MSLIESCFHKMRKLLQWVLGEEEKISGLKIAGNFKKHIPDMATYNQLILIFCTCNFRLGDFKRKKYSKTNTVSLLHWHI